MKEYRDKYVNKKAEEYEANRVNTIQWQKEQKIVELYINKLKPETILDVPVGTGRFFGKHKTTGIDISIDMLDIAEKKADNKDRLLLGDVFKIDYIDEFDVVVSMRFLNWVTTEELELVIKNLTKATKKNLILGIHLDVGQEGSVHFHKKEDVERIFKDNNLTVIDKNLAREDDYYIFLLEKKPRLTVSYNIMAHPKRKEYISYLQEKLGDVKVIWDTQNNVWHTRKKCLRDHIKQDCDFGITIQDDSIVCDNFKEKAEEFINSIGDKDAVYNFFYAKNLDRYIITSAVSSGFNYIRRDDIKNEICFAFPTHLITEMIKSCDSKKNKKIKPIDQPDADWVMDYRYMHFNDIPVYFSLPSLIDHRCPENSLYYPSHSIKRTGKDLRTCWWFDGDEWGRGNKNTHTGGLQILYKNGKII